MLFRSAHEVEGQPGIEDRNDHGSYDNTGCHPADGFPAAPLLDGTGIAEQQQATIEIIGGGEVALHQRPCRLVGGVDDIGQKQGGHGIDQTLQLTVGPDIGATLLGFLTGMKPTYCDKRPARGDINHGC